MRKSLYCLTAIVIAIGSFYAGIVCQPRVETETLDDHNYESYPLIQLQHSQSRQSDYEYLKREINRGRMTFPNTHIHLEMPVSTPTEAEH